VEDGGDGAGWGTEPTALSNGFHALSDYTYDRLGRTVRTDRWRFTENPAATADPDRPHAVTIVKYDDAHATVTTTSSDGDVTVERRDGAGRVRHTTRAFGTTDAIDVDALWSAAGDVLTETTTPAPTTSGKLVRETDFDPLGRVATVHEADRVVLKVSRDGYDRENGATTPQNGTVTRDLDAFGRPVASHATVATGTIDTKTVWSGSDHRIEFDDGAKHVTTYQYDGIDRLWTETTGLGTTTRTYYPGSTRPYVVTDPAMTTSTSTYDAVGRLASDTIVDGPALGTSRATLVRSYGWTPLGQLSSAAVQGGAKVTWTYDSLGAPLREYNDALPFGVEHAYSTHERTTRLLYGNATAASLVRINDGLGRPTSLALGKAMLAEWTYTGALTDVLYGNGAKAHATYDDRVRAVGLHVTSPSGAALAGIDQRLGADDAPRLRQLAVGATWKGTDLFKADAIGRVTNEDRLVPNVSVVAASGLASDVPDSAVDAAWNLQSTWSAYSLDGAGNWLARTGAGAFTPTIDATNRYTAINAEVPQYDAAGRLRVFESDTLAWNGDGQLTSAARGGATTTYDVDALGRRYREHNASGSTFLVWGGDAIVALGNDADPLSARVRAGAGSDDTVALAEKLGTGAIYYVHAGLDGSSMATTDANAALVEGYAYSAFGETSFVDPALGVVGQSKIDQRFLFQGQLYDATYGRYAMRAREYDPKWGRFVSPDPIGLGGGANRYAFVGNRPLTTVDPSGLCGQPAATGGPAAPELSPFVRNKLEEIAFEAKVLGTIADALHSLDQDGSTLGGIQAGLQGFGPIGGAAGEVLPLAEEGLVELSAAGEALQTMEGVVLEANTIARGEQFLGSAAAPTYDWALKTVLNRNLLPTIADISDVGLQETVSNAVGLRYQLLGFEAPFYNFVSGVWARADVIARIPWLDLPDNFLFYLEAKAGLNPGFTLAQLANLAAGLDKTFLPVEFTPEWAAAHGLSPNTVYYLLQINMFWKFYSR
jgi:RHS repeat-associated protein